MMLAALKTDQSLKTLTDVILNRKTPDSLLGEARFELVNLALKHGLGPYLLHVLRSSEVDLFADEVWLPLIEDERVSALYYMALQQSQKQIEQALDQASIPRIWLKGIVLASTIYENPTLRPMVDIDVLVPFDLRRDALRIAQDLGYDFVHDPHQLFQSDEVYILVSSHHYHLKSPFSDLSQVELHYRFFKNQKLLDESQSQWLWNETRVVVDHDEQMHLPSLKPEAQLLYLCAHTFLAHGMDVFFLQRCLDWHLIITNEELDWDQVVDKAAEFQWTHALREALQLTQHFFATDVPEDVIAYLDHQMVSSHERAQFQRLNGPGAQLEKLLVVLSNLSFADRIRFVLRTIFPSTAYMRDHYQIAEKQPVWMYYLRRWYSQVKLVWQAVLQRLLRSV